LTQFGGVANEQFKFLLCEVRRNGALTQLLFSVNWQAGKAMFACIDKICLPTCDVCGRDPQRHVNVDSGRPLCAKSGLSLTAWRTGETLG